MGGPFAIQLRLMAYRHMLDGGPSPVTSREQVVEIEIKGESIAEEPICPRCLTCIPRLD